MSLDISSLPREYPRQFVTADLDPGDWSQLKTAFDDLEARDIHEVNALERWLLDWSELISVVEGEKNLRYIRMTCQTDDQAVERAYLDFVENVEPDVKQANARLQKRYISRPARAQLPKNRYAVLDRQIENRVAIFREANVSLETKDAKLSQQYEKITGAMIVEFQGQERTLPQMKAFLEHTDRSVRQQAWELIANRYLQDREVLDQIYDNMVECRQQIARNAGFETYRDYAFRRLERFDYTPEHCFEFHRAVQTHIVPLARALQERRRKKLGLDVLRPWDAEVDLEGMPPLRPFESVSQLVDGCSAIFARTDGELASHFRRMVELNLLDLESRKGKAPGGYQESLHEHRLPFIFWNAVGRHVDVIVLLHEAGHAFHAFAVRNEPLYFYRQYPIEFDEVASMGMELLSAKHWEVFYSSEDVVRARQQHLELIVQLLARVAGGDAFQHWVYTHPGHSRQERENAWLDIQRRLGGIESWEGYEDAERMQWHTVLHFYVVPFYFIEYGIAQLGALGIWAQSRSDYRFAVEAYKRALALGGSRPLPELFEAAGVRFDFGDESVSRIAASLRTELFGED